MSKLFFVRLFVLVIIGVTLTGCLNFNLFNDSFLDKFEPFGITSLDQVQGKGPVNIVLENLTTESCHGEYVGVTVFYLDSSGAQRSLPVRNIPAVAPDKRDPTAANYDPDFRRTIVLSCGVRAVWIEATVYRRKITAKTKADSAYIPDVNEKTKDIIFPDGSHNTFPFGDVKGRTEGTTGGSDVTFYSVESTFEGKSAFRFPPGAILSETRQFKCGDVIVFGILDRLASNGTIIEQTYADDVTYTYFTAGDFLCNENPRQIWNETTQQFEDITNPSESVYYDDANQTLLKKFYQYPDAYIILPFVISGIDQINAASTALVTQAQQLAGKIDQQINN